MSKSILILEENSVVHGLIGSALEIDGVTLHHEFNPANYVDAAKSLMPDLILISNEDQKNGYAVTRELKGGGAADVPLILLAGSKESVNPTELRELKVAGIVRKPFEASDLQQQVSKHLDVTDMIGTAYEYRKAQSIEEREDPLADLHVVDADVLTLLHEPEGDGSQVEPPKVDFSPVLEVDDADAVIDEEALAETLQPESAFEPIEADMDDEPEASLEDVTAPEGEAAAEAAFAERSPMPEFGTFDDDAPIHEERMDLNRPDDDATSWEQAADEPIDLGEPIEELEELGPEDLLEEEGPEAAALSPEPLDQDLDETSAEPLPPLDDIEVELADDELRLDAVGEELGGGDVDLSDLPDLETEVEEEASADEDIPLAVRRMMELRPVFSPPEGGDTRGDDEGAGEIESVSLVFEDEDGQFEEDLGSLDELNLDAEPALDVEADELLAAGDDLPQASEAPGSEWDGSAEEDQEEFRAEMLGTEEIDEDRILEALGEGPPETEEDESQYLTASNEQEEMEELVSLAELEDEALATTEPEEEEELILDQDEEAMMLSALEEEASFETPLPAPPAEPEQGPPLTSEPVLEALPDEPNLEALEAEAMGELEDLEDTMTGLEEETQAAPAPSAFPRVDEPNLVDAIAAEGGGLPSGALEEGGDDEDWNPGDGDDDAEWVMDELGEGEPLEGRDAASGGFMEDDVTDIDLDRLDGSSQEEVDPLLDGESAAYVEKELGDDALDEVYDFEAELSGLRSEIDANPEGERIDDLLQREGIKAAVADLDFDLPPEEDNLSRAMGISELPGDTPADAGEAMDDDAFAGAMPSGAASTPATEGLEAELRARLEAALDDVIALSVRKAVEQEVPRLMARLKEEDTSA